MKERITVTIDPTVTRRARKLAHAKKTSVSGLIEQLLISAPAPGGKMRAPFAQRWAGKFEIAKTHPGDLRMRVLKEKYQLAKP